jgi:hypothetical protein
MIFGKHHFGEHWICRIVQTCVNAVVLRTTVAMQHAVAANDNSIRYRRCDVCRGRMKLTSRLPALLKLPAQDLYECTECDFGFSVEADRPWVPLG